MTDTNICLPLKSLNDFVLKERGNYDSHSSLIGQLKNNHIYRPIHPGPRKFYTSNVNFLNEKDAEISMEGGIWSYHSNVGPIEVTDSLELRKYGQQLADYIQNCLGTVLWRKLEKQDLDFNILYLSNKYNDVQISLNILRRKGKNTLILYVTKW